MEGWKVLTERLGISGAIRFLTQYVPGLGDPGAHAEGVTPWS
jgi:hypothetical protein